MSIGSSHSLLMSILKSPLPTEPIILDFSYLNKQSSKNEPAQSYFSSNNLPELTLFQLETIKELFDDDVDDKMDYIELNEYQINDRTITENEQVSAEQTIIYSNDNHGNYNTSNDVSNNINSNVVSDSDEFAYYTMESFNTSFILHAPTEFDHYCGPNFDRSFIE